MFSVLDPVKDRDRWNVVVSSLGPAGNDPHFSAWYLEAERILGGTPLLAVWTEAGGYTVAKPAVLRDVVVAGQRHGIDATSPHGYGGPVANAGPATYDRFDEAWTEWCKGRGVICEYTALNSMMNQTFLMNHWIKKEERTRTALTHRKDVVWVYLMPRWWEEPTDLRKIGYHDNRIAGVKAARKAGVEVATAVDVVNDDVMFPEMYREAMERKQAADRWLFPASYLRAMCYGGQVFHALVDGVVEAAAVVIAGGETAYYHMAANRLDHPKACAGDLLVHEIALWCRERGFRYLHLGGGVTKATDDPVLFFKSGFSDLRAPAYSTFRVFDQAAYREACAAKAEQEIAETGAEFTTAFEPLYRREAS